MSTFASFEKAKMVRFINQFGSSFVVRRAAKNEYGEPKMEDEVITTFNGVYHEAISGYMQETKNNAASFIRMVSPMIVCLQDEETTNKILPDDYIEIFDRKYIVVRLNNVGKLGYAWDITLRLEDNGRDT